MKKPLKIAITGGIGSGKSFVCDLLHSIYKIPIYNTDRKVQDDIMKRPEVHQKITQIFGDDSYINGSINREKFRKLLFYDSDARAKMDKIVADELRTDMNQWCDQQTTPYVIVECAILFEHKMEHLFDKIVTVVCPMDIRLKRLAGRRDGLDEKREAEFSDTHKRIISIQTTDEEKIEKSDFVLHSGDGVTEELKVLHEKIMELV